MIADKTTAADTVKFLGEVIDQIKPGSENVRLFCDQHSAHWGVDVLRFVEE